MEEMIVKLRKENKKLREENEELKGENADLESSSEWDTNLNTLKEDKLDLLQKIDILTKELKQCHAIFSRQQEERQERKQNKKK